MACDILIFDEFGHILGWLPTVRSVGGSSLSAEQQIVLDSMKWTTFKNASSAVVLVTG